MNIYLLTQEQTRGYDTYDSMVVCAKNEDEARLIHPEGWNYKGVNRWPEDCLSCVWADDPEHVNVKLIGTASPGTAEGIILSSFNAG